MRVERGHLVHPDAVGAEQPAHLADERAAATVADEMEWKFRQSPAVEFGDKVGLQKPGRHGGGDCVGVVLRKQSGQIAPVELDDNLRAGIVRGLPARNLPGRDDETAAVAHTYFVADD